MFTPRAKARRIVLYGRCVAEPAIEFIVRLPIFLLTPERIALFLVGRDYHSLSALSMKRARRTGRGVPLTEIPALTAREAALSPRDPARLDESWLSTRFGGEAERYVKVYSMRTLRELTSLKMSCAALGATFSLLANIAPAAAQEDDGGDAFIVLGAASLPEFEGADEQQIVPFAVLRFNAWGAGVEVDGLQGRINVLGEGSILRAGPAFSFTPPRDSDDPAIEALREVDFAVEAGAYVGFEAPFGGFDEGTLSGMVQVRHDVLDEHNGLLVTPELEYFFAVNRLFRVGVGVNATWASDDYMDAYFGVSADDAAASGLARFDAGAGFKDAGAEVYSILSFSEQWGVFTRVAYNRLLGDAADSSIVRDVGDRDQLFYGAGLFYRF